MEWLFDRFRRPGAPIVISGPPGVGKTALLKQFLATARVRRPPLVLTTRYRPDESMIEISEKIDELYRDRNPPEIVAIDEAETLDERQLNIITGRVLNLKAVRTLIFVTRRQPKITRAEVLQLQPLSAAACWARTFLARRSLAQLKRPPACRSRSGCSLNSCADAIRRRSRGCFGGDLRSQSAAHPSRRETDHRGQAEDHTRQ
jgi:hypothetical protein